MLTAFRGTVCHTLGDPGESNDPAVIESFTDGILLVRDGKVERLAPASDLLPQLGDDVELIDHRGKLLVPGFIDTHVHYPQLDMIGSYGEQLLEWLNNYTFPAERRFADAEHARQTAEFFLDQLLLNGTTTALVFATVHPQSVDALFGAARQRSMRLVAGKVLMDRNCPDYLQDTAESGDRDSRSLIERWHGQDRLLYAVTPRFVGTSSEDQLQRAGKILDDHAGVYLHTHLAENKAEIDWVAELFPDSRSYLDVYDRFALVRERAVFAHCIHLDDQDRQRLGATGAAVAFCPTSNLFLGSGLFDLGATRAHGIRVGMGTDVGAGTSFNMLQTLNEGYKVSQLRGQKLSAWRALYLATLGGAEALYLDDRLGNFMPGREADFVVLDPAATPLLARRLNDVDDIAEQLFVLITLGDDRAIAETYLMGRAARPSG